MEKIGGFRRLAVSTAPYIACIAVIAVYCALYARGYFVLTEGWFSEYASLIRAGEIPYRDFSLLLAPAYPITIALFQTLFGTGILALRILGIAVTCGIAVTLLHILRRYVNPWAAAFAAACATIYYQSGVAYIGYDFTQFVTLYLLLAAASALRSLEPESDARRRLSRSAIAVGVFSVLAALTKQSNGTIAAFILVAATTACYAFLFPSRIAWRRIGAMCLGAAVPLGLVLLALTATGALNAFVSQTVLAAGAAKGNLNVFSWLIAVIYNPPGLLFGTEQVLERSAIFIGAIGLAVIICTGLFRLAPGRANSPVVRSLLVNASAIFGLAALLVLILSIHEGHYHYWAGLLRLEKPFYEEIFVYSVDFGFVVTLVAAVILIHSRKKAAAFAFIAGAISLGLTFGNGTSAGLSEISVFFPVAFLFAFLLNWAGRWLLPAALPVALGLALCAPFVHTKFDQPYSWWYVKSAPVQAKQCAPVMGVLGGLCMPLHDYSALERVTASIETHSKTDNAIYVYPHMPILYMLANRKPFDNAVVSWFDFTSDALATKVRDDLLKNPPQVIVAAELPSTVMAAHERLFRGGRPLVQRSILAAISKLRSSGVIRLVERSDLQGTPIDVFVRTGKPVLTVRPPFMHIARPFIPTEPPQPHRVDAFEHSFPGMIFLDLLLIFGLSCATGYGAFCLLVPTFLRTRLALFTLLPALGLWQLAIACAYTIWLNLPISAALGLSAAVGIGLGLVALHRKALWLPPAQALIEPSFLLRGLLFVGILCAVLSPALVTGIPTTPYRVGIDQVGYGEVSQYLVEGGTIRSARYALLDQLATPELPKAKLQNNRALNFGTYVNSEFLLKALRWGFPGVVAALTLATGSVHAYRLEFIIPIFGLAALLFLVYRVMRDYFSASWPIALVAVACVALNCNLLNVYYEGELVETFIQAAFVLLGVLLLHFRVTSPPEAPIVEGLKQNSKSVLLFGFLIAAFFAAYNETLVLFLAFAFLIAVIDFVIGRGFQWKSIAFVAIGFFLGALAVFPLSARWFQYSLANAANLSHAGFWQPHWGSLSEIVGLQNMYGVVGYLLRSRDNADIVWMAILSAFVFATMAYFLWRGRGIDRAFWGASPLLVLIAFVKMHIMDGILNYPYMKVYTILAPFIVVLFLAGLSWERPRIRKVLAKHPAIQLVRLSPLILTAGLVVLAGTQYVRQYINQESFVTSDAFSLYSFDGVHRALNQYALLTTHRAPAIADFMLTPLIDMNMVNENDQEKFIAPYLNRKVAIIVRKDGVSCWQCLKGKYGPKWFDLNPSYALVVPGYNLSHICVRDAEQYQLGILQATNPADWPGLPSPQCDYYLGPSLVAVKNTSVDTL